MGRSKVDEHDGFRFFVLAMHHVEMTVNRSGRTAVWHKPQIVYRFNLGGLKQCLPFKTEPVKRNLEIISRMQLPQSGSIDRHP